jgi:polysaccharide pyruvyl transferase WcaK-like protein
MAASFMKLWRHGGRRGNLRNGGREPGSGCAGTSHGTTVNGRARGPKKIAFFGHFDGTNFGNESSLQATLHHLRRFHPEADVICICSDPLLTASTYHVRALPFSGVLRTPWNPKSPLKRLARKIGTALRQPFQWVKCIRSIRGTEMLLVPGTGLLTDAYGLRGWGPYGLLKWSLIARACGCKVALVSVGAGPIHSMVGRWCVGLVISLSEFRSYRDIPSLRYLEDIGIARDGDAIFPDLAFSLPDCMIPHCKRAGADRPVVGLGVMDYSGTYHAGGSTEPAFQGYLETLAESSRWLLDRGYNIRLLSGDLVDSHARRAFRGVLKDKLPTHDCDRIIDEPVASVADLLLQIASTDFVVATRFHNIVFGFLCGKPVISISFHHKCESLMGMMGMSDYCLEMGGLKADRLIDTLRHIEANADAVRHSVRDRTTAFRQALDEQYAMLFHTTRQELRSAELTAS